MGLVRRRVKEKQNGSKHVREDFAYEVHQKVQLTASGAHTGCFPTGTCTKSRDAKHRPKKDSS